MPFFGLGFAMCIVPIWSLVPLVCKDPDMRVIHVGACYVQMSIWLFVGNYLYGALLDRAGSYLEPEVMFVVCGGLGILGTVFLQRRLLEDEGRTTNLLEGAPPPTSRGSLAQRWRDNMDLLTPTELAFLCPGPEVERNEDGSEEVRGVFLHVHHRRSRYDRRTRARGEVV